MQVITTSTDLKINGISYPKVGWVAISPSADYIKIVSQDDFNFSILKNTHFSEIQLNGVNETFSDTLEKLNTALKFAPNFGSVAGSVAEGNHSHNEIKAQEVPRNSNFDNLTDTGYYHCSSNIDMLNMSNRPSNLAGLLEVFKLNNFIYQTWTNFWGGNIYKRGYYTDHTVTADKRWSKWVQMSTKNNTPTVYLGNANAPTNPGNYRIGDIYLRNNSTRYMYMCNYNTNGTAKQWHRFDNL